MRVETEYLLGALAALDPNGPTVKVAQLNQAELATLTRAADILERLRATWNEGQDEGVIETNVALAMYTMRELIEDKGRIELWA